MSNQHPLTAISTLSAALANDNNSLAIAPELMGAEGLPPDLHHRPHSSSEGEDQQSHAFAYQNSSARDEGSGSGSGSGTKGWSGHSHHGNGSGRSTQNPWEEGYRDHPKSLAQDYSELESQVANINTENEGQDTRAGDAGEAPPKPRKRARVSKPRQSRESRQNGNNDDGVPEEGVFDYADPSGDYKLGPVYTYPSSSAAQACVRCHKIKRKCDNARPRCAGCSKADVACVFELSPATVSYVSGLKSDNLALTSQIASASERVQHLESVIANMERGLPPPLETPHQQQESVQFTSAEDLKHQADFAGLAKSILSVQSHQLANPVFGAPAPLETHQRPITSPRGAFGFSALMPESTLPPYPPYEVAMQAVETFFVCNAISYPFLDKNEFLRDMDEIYHRQSNGHARTTPWTPGGNDPEADAIAGKEFIMFIVIAIGTTNRERMGEVERGSSKVFKERAFMTLEAAIGKEDILCVQSLILLGIYSMFDPSGISLWHVVGFAARIAIALDLHRRVDDAGFPAKVVEQRKRVFYSLYNLDRLVATTLSKPLAISDDDIDVDLPSGLPSDSPFRGRPRVDFTRHIIKLRRLLGVILTTVYSVSGTQNSLPEAERNNIILDLHGRLDSWLAECPVTPSSTDKEEKRGMITNHSWFSLNYHQGLCLLYRPSPLYPNMINERLSSLHQASSRCVDLYLDLWQDRKVSYNLINVSLQFLACISLLYCLCEYDTRKGDGSTINGDGNNWKDQVNQRLGQCHDLLEAFSGGAIPETIKYKEIFQTLSNLLLARYGPINHTKTNDQNGTTSMVVNGSGSGPIVPPSNSSNEATQEEGEAWNAMTQLWYHSGGFNFDNPNTSLSLSSLMGNGNGNGNGQEIEGGGIPLATSLVGEDGLVQGLWHQI